jgi:hypothetical protein
MNKSYVLAALAFLGLSAALTGCGSSDSTPQGRVRVINALNSVPNNANVDVNVNNGQGVSSNVPFGQATTSAVTVNSGSTVPVGVNQTGTTTSLITGSTANITQGADNLVLVTGVIGQTGGLAPAVVSLAPVNLSNTPVSNQARVYFINAAPDVAQATFTYTITNPGGTPGTSTATAASLNYKEISAEQFVTIIDANSTEALTITTGAETITLNTAPLAGSHTYAVVLTGRSAASAGTPALAAQVIRLDP